MIAESTAESTAESVSQPRAVILDSRGVLALDGADRVAFLQGLVSNDVEKAAAGWAIHAAFLTPQGKYLHDFAVAALGERLLLDVEADRREDLLRRLKPYRLRSKVTLADATPDFAVAALFGPGAPERLGLSAEPGSAAPFGGGIAFTDPRLADLGARAILPRQEAATILADAGFAPADAAEYDRLRLSLGVPDASRDLTVEKAILLESNFDLLNAISWDKGCYMGQELTARTRYRGLIRKRLFPVSVEGPLPAPGTPVLLDGKEAGEIRSGRDGLALAMLRLEELAAAEAEDRPLTAGKARVIVRRPGWLAV